MPADAQIHVGSMALPTGPVTQQRPTVDVLGYGIRLAILCAFAAMAAMSWTRSINWDEFYFLSHVHAHLDGRLDRPLQTVFVHAFGWLAGVSGHEVDQIVAARLVMLGFFAASCVALHKIATALADKTSADVAVLAFVTSGFAIAHGSSFRADPMAAGLLMGAVAIMMTTRMSILHVLAVAVLSALALLVTVKSALYLPVYIAALVWRWGERGIILRCLGAGVVALVIAAVVFSWHASGITAGVGAGAKDNLGEAARVTLGGSGFLPRWPEVSLWMLFSIGALVLAAASLHAATNNRFRAVLVLFAFPILSVVLYRNAYPYFFPFAVPALMVAVAVGSQALRGGLLWRLAVVLMLAGGFMQTQRASSEGNALQQATLSEVHRIFPEPVTYIDQNGMVSSFERVGFFMSTWGIATYRAAGRPVFAELIERHQPPLLLANRAELHAALRPQEGETQALGLLVEDARTLRNSYVHHAGAIWLAGDDIMLSEGRGVAELPFAGEYRIESIKPVTLKGRLVVPGDVVSLEGGAVEIQGTPGTTVRVIWHTRAGPSQVTLSETGLYAGFWRL